MDSYDSINHPLITCGWDCPANGIWGTAYGTPGEPLQGSSWTVGIYFALGTLDNNESAGNGLPDIRLSLGTGPGSTAQMLSGELAGQFVASAYFDTGAVPGDMITAEVLVYNGPSYFNCTLRSHSAEFAMPALSGAQFPLNVGDYMQPFSVSSVPEPSGLLFGVCACAVLLTQKRVRANR